MNADGSSGYHPGNAGSSSMTAVALWCLRLLQVPAGDPRVQGSLGWLRQNYTYDRMIGGFSPTSTYYYMWAAQKGIEASPDDGLGGAIYADNFGDRDPAALGFAEEPRSAYFDLAYTLVAQWQDPAGAWGTQFGGSPRGWTDLSSHTFALLILERSPGGICLDQDEDEFCDREDTCPEVPNPDQADEDEDGVGDVCDNCPRVINRSQDDADGDGIGDACDRYCCIPDGNPEVCDGIDNTCNGLVDLNEDGTTVVQQLRCGTGVAGRCALGVLACDDGEVVCPPDQTAVEETCNLEDDDCDGVVDEGVLNVCGFCGPDPDQPCEVNEAVCVGVVCDRDAFCRRGECVPSCAAVACPHGQACIDGACDTVHCGGVVCRDWEACIDDGCVDDECWSDDCGEGRTCVDGACDDDPCHGIRCPAHQRCAIHDGTAQCVADWLEDGPTDGGPSGDVDLGLEADLGVERDLGLEPDSGVRADVGSADDSQGEDEAVSESCDCESAPSPLTWMLFAPGLMLGRRRPALLRRG